MGDRGVGLGFYASEPHQRPHVDVVGPDWNAKIALDTFEVLVRSGKVPPKVIRRTVELLREHQDEAIEAFHATRGGHPQLAVRPWRIRQRTGIHRELSPVIVHLMQQLTQALRVEPELGSSL